MKRHVLIWSMVLLFGFVSALGLCIQALYAPQAVAAIDDMHKVIAVDAGHGGIDGGVRGITSKKKESEINLEIAKAQYILFIFICFILFINAFIERLIAIRKRWLPLFGEHGCLYSGNMVY